MEQKQTESQSLYLAIEHSSVQMVAELLSMPDGRAMLFTQDEEGNTLLHLLIKKIVHNVQFNIKLLDEQFEILKLICNTKEAVAINLIENKKGETPFICAMQSIFRDLKELLISIVNINVSNNQGKTALHIAARYGDEYAVKLLIAAGADCNKQDIFGQTPLRVAELRVIDEEKRHVVNLLRSYTKNDSAFENQITSESFLPAEMLVDIFSYCTLSELSKLAQCCKVFNETINANQSALFKGMTLSPSRYIGTSKPFYASYLTYAIVEEKYTAIVKHWFFDTTNSQASVRQMSSQFERLFNKTIPGDFTQVSQYVATLSSIADILNYKEKCFLTSEAAMNHFQKMEVADAKKYILVACWISKRNLSKLLKKNTESEKPSSPLIINRNDFDPIIKLGHIQALSYFNSDKSIEKTVSNPFCITNEEVLNAFINKFQLNNLAYWSKQARLGDSVDVIEKITNKKYVVPYGIAYIYNSINNPAFTTEDKLSDLYNLNNANKRHQEKKYFQFFSQPNKVVKTCYESAHQLKDLIEPSEYPFTI